MKIKTIFENVAAIAEAAALCFLIWPLAIAAALIDYATGNTSDYDRK